MPKYVPFEEIEALADIEQLADMLNLTLKGGATKRCLCPVHGGDDRTLCVSPSVKSKRGSMGVWYCQKTQEGGDRIGLVAHCMEMGQQEAALFIQSQFAEGTVYSEPSNSTVHSRTVPPSITKRDAPPQPPAFDPEKFASRLVWHDDLKELGLSEDQAKELSLGFHPQQKFLYIPIRWPTGQIAGWLGFRKGEDLKIPPRWIPAPTNVVALKRA